MGKKGNLSDLKCGMLFGATRAGVGIETNLIIFSHTTISRAYRELVRKRQKNLLSGNSVIGNPLLMKLVAGEWTD